MQLKGLSIFSSGWKDITLYPAILTFNNQHPNDYSFMHFSSSGNTLSLLTEHIKLLAKQLSFTTRRCTTSLIVIHDFGTSLPKKLFPPGYWRAVKAMRYVVFFYHKYIHIYLIYIENIWIFFTCCLCLICLKLFIFFNII